MKLQLKWPASNIRKYFLLMLTWRRNFIPLLSIYYLSLPNTTANQIWLYTAIGFVAGLIFQIPGGFLGDKRGNKTVLILSKICLIGSSLAFIIGTNFRVFAIGSALLSMGIQGFFVGNWASFLHDTLSTIGKANQFKKISSRIRGRVSFTSIFLILGIPLFATISLKVPFVIALGIDIIGLIVALSLVHVRSPDHKKGHRISLKDIVTTIKKTKKTWFYSIGLFSAIIIAFLVSDSVFRYPYLESLGYPIAFIGIVMAGSRLVRFVVAHYTHKIEKLIKLKYLMLIEIFVFGWYYLTTSMINNPYILWIVFSLVIGYMWWRSDIYTDHLINCLPEKKHKTTMLSIKGRVGSIIQIVVVFFIGFVMTQSYKTGFTTLGIAIFIMLTGAYIFFRKETKEQTKFS